MAVSIVEALPSWRFGAKLGRIRPDCSHTGFAERTSYPVDFGCPPDRLGIPSCGRRSTSPVSSQSSTGVIVMADSGRSSSSRATVAMASTTSIPSMTWPKIVCLPNSEGVPACA